MAGFKTHLLWAIGGGCALAAIGVSKGHIDPKEAGAVVILGTMGGLLPDLDSDTGKPLELLFQLLGVLIPMSIYLLLKPHLGGDIAVMLLVVTLGYLAVQYLLCPLIKKLTVHRGIMHSIPFAVLCGQIAFLLFSAVPRLTAIYYAIAVFSGCMIHLVLDEFYSISFKGIVPRFNRASGSALAFYSSSAGATLVVYLLLIITSYVIFGDNFNDTLTELMAFFKSENRFRF